MLQLLLCVGRWGRGGGWDEAEVVCPCPPICNDVTFISELLICKLNKCNNETEEYEKLQLEKMK